MLSLHIDVTTIHIRDGMRKDVEHTIADSKSGEPLWVSPAMNSVMPSEQGRTVWGKSCAEEELTNIG